MEEEALFEPLDEDAERRYTEAKSSERREERHKRREERHKTDASIFSFFFPSWRSPGYSLMRLPFGTTTYL